MLSPACPASPITTEYVAVRNHTHRGLSWVHAAKHGRYDGPTRTLCGRRCYGWEGVARTTEDTLRVVECRACRTALGITAEVTGTWRGHINRSGTAFSCAVVGYVWNGQTIRESVTLCDRTVPADAPLQSFDANAINCHTCRTELRRASPGRAR